MSDRNFHVSCSPISQSSETGTHIWLLDIAGLDQAGLARSLQNLCPAERKRADNFKNRRNEFIATRACVRLCLARYLNCAPEAIAFGTEPDGKPFVVGQPIQFNLSHSGSLLALAVDSQHRLGLDIEAPRRTRNYLDIADRYFHPRESGLLNSLPAFDQAARFFELWTLKEAFFKALGTGIATGLDKAAFSLEGEKIRCEFARDLELEPANWQFYQTQVREQTWLGLAVETPTPISPRWFDASEFWAN